MKKKKAGAAVAEIRLHILPPQIERRQTFALVKKYPKILFHIWTTNVMASSGEELNCRFWSIFRSQIPGFLVAEIRLWLTTSAAVIGGRRNLEEFPLGSAAGRKSSDSKSPNFLDRSQCCKTFQHLSNLSSRKSRLSMLRIELIWLTENGEGFQRRKKNV